MIKIKAAICDDEVNILPILESSLRRAGEAQAITIETKLYQNGKDLLADIASGMVFDAIFLDIKMDSIDGIMLGEILLDQLHFRRVIFVSGESNLVQKAFAAHPLYYIYKETMDSAEGFPMAVNLLKREIHRHSLTIDVVEVNGTRSKVLSGSLLYMEARSNYVELVMRDGTRKRTRSTMETMEVQAKNFGFLRCHRSYLVNFFAIESMKKDGFELYNKELIPIGKSRRKEAEEWYYDMALKEG